MKKRLVFVLVAFLTAPAAFCTTSLLRLGRANSPDGLWQRVPSNTLPITEEGAFLDTYESAVGFYRMEIEPGEDWGFPLYMPLEDVPELGLKIASELLDELRDMGGDNSWEDAVLGSVAFPMYTPGVEGPAYMEFAVLSPPPERPGSPFEATRGKSPRPLKAPSAPRSPLALQCSDFSPRGRILVSLTEDDIPVVEYSTKGITRTECLRKMAKSSAVRIVKIPDGFTVAENRNGELLAYFGSPPVYYPDEIMEFCDGEFEGWGDDIKENHPAAPQFTGQAYKSYDAFKKDLQESPRLLEAARRRKHAAGML